MDPRHARILIGIASAIAVLLVAVVVIVATGGDDEPQAGTTTPTTAGAIASSTTTPPPATTTTLPATTSSTTTSSTTTTSTATTTTTTSATLPSGPCSALPSTGVGAAGTNQTVVWGDVDGNGHDDEVTIYHEAGSWWINVSLDYGWSTEIPLTGMVARAIDVVNLGVGEEVIIAQTDAGASVEILGFFSFTGCDIIHLIDGNTGLETAFPLGGGVTHMDGLTCTADGIRTTSSVNDMNDPALWKYTETDYLYVPGLGELQPLASSIRLLTSPADDATIFGAGAFGC